MQCDLSNRADALIVKHSHVLVFFTVAQVMTWGGSCAGELATVGRTRTPFWFLWMRRMMCLWIAGLSSWMQKSQLKVEKMALRNLSLPR